MTLAWIFGIIAPKTSAHDLHNQPQIGKLNMLPSKQLKLLASISLLFSTFTLAACTETSTKELGDSVARGLCTGSSNCSINCPQGESPDPFGNCQPDALAR
jgi:hypothetical protein